MSVLATLALAVLHLLAQVGVVVSAPAEVRGGDNAVVTVEVRAPAGRDVELVAPSFAPFRTVRTQRLASDGGGGGAALRAPWQVIEWRYVLAPPDTAAGRYVFFPFVARVTGRGARAVEARSHPWEITVRAAPPPPIAARPSEVPRARAARGVEVHARLAADTVYVGQQATYTLSVLVAAGVRDRLRRNPEFVPPELRGVLAYDLPAGQRTERAPGVDVHVFQRALFPLAPGVIAVPPATLNYSLPLGAGFFSREESYTERSEPVRLVVREPPAAGRPPEWFGAVGRLRVAARLDTAAARVGDPVVYTLRVEGEGNVSLLPRPPLTVPGAAAVAAGERVTIDSSSARVRGAKEFDWLLTPGRAGELPIAAPRYPFFDPELARYEVASADALTVAVAPGALAGAPGAAPPDARATSVAGAALSFRPTLVGERGPPLAARPVFWALAVAAPVPLLAALALRRRRAAGPATVDPAAALAALGGRAAARDAAPLDAVRAVRRRFLEALAARLDVPVERLAEARDRVRLLRRCGVTGDCARAVDATLARLDAAAFGLGAPPARGDDAPASAEPTSAETARPAPVDPAVLAAEAVALLGRVDGEACGDPTGRGPAARAAARARRGERLARLGWGSAALATLGAAALTAAGWWRPVTRSVFGDAPAATVVQGQGDPRPAFARGLDAAARRDWGGAARAFRAAAGAAPRAADAWANAGTAAWLAGDTLQAAAGWQHALRVDPRADDVRDRLALLPAATDGVRAGVSPIPADWGAAAALGAWWLASVVAAAGVLVPTASAGRRAARAVAPRLAVTALLLGGGTAWLAATQTLRERALVRAAGPLRTDPAVGAEPSAQADFTDVARVEARQGDWVRVSLDGDRAGWLPAEALLPLE